MSLLVILFLVIINVFNNVRSSAPSSASSKLNAIDKFMMTCIFMIFSAIIEYAILLSINTLKAENPYTEEEQARIQDHPKSDSSNKYDLKVFLSSSLKS